MHPILVHLSGDLSITTYGFMIALGLLAASWLAGWSGRRRGMPSEFFFDLTLVAFVSGFLGARVLYILTELDEFLRNPAALIFSRTGFVFLGGLIAAVPACIWWIRRKGHDVWMTADVVAPAITLGHAFGRIGCHLAGCCWGGVCSAPIAIRVPRVENPDGSLYEGSAWADHVHQGWISLTDAFSLPIWPVQLMESAGLFLITACLMLLFLRGASRGHVFAAYLISYAVLRFGLEYLRGDAARGLFFGGLLSTSQLISIGLLLAGVVLLMVVKPARSGNPPPPPGTPRRPTDALREASSSPPPTAS